MPCLIPAETPPSFSEGMVRAGHSSSSSSSSSSLALSQPPPPRPPLQAKTHAVAPSSASVADGCYSTSPEDDSEPAPVYGFAYGGVGPVDEEDEYSEAETATDVGEEDEAERGACTVPPSPSSSSSSSSSSYSCCSRSVADAVASAAAAAASSPRALIAPLAHPSLRTPLPRLAVVLDLDETLVSNRSQMAWCSDNEVLPRPHLHTFLSTVASFAEVVLWTASTRDVALDAVAAVDPLGQHFDHVVARSPAWFSGEVPYTKDLRLLGRPLARTVIVENNPDCVSGNRANAILVPDFLGTPEQAGDAALLVVLELLEEMAASARPVHEVCRRLQGVHTHAHAYTYTHRCLPRARCYTASTLAVTVTSLRFLRTANHARSMRRRDSQRKNNGRCWQSVW